MVTMRIEPVYFGSPVLTLYGDYPYHNLAAHLLTGGQVTYHGSQKALHGPYAVTGRCACETCLPDDSKARDERFRLVITDGQVELLHVHPKSLAAR